MRIVVVTPWFPTVDGPHSGLFVAREVDALSETHDVHVIHLDWTGDSPHPPARGFTLEHIRLRRHRPWDFFRARAAVRSSTLGADVVHSHSLTVLVPWWHGRLTALPWVHSEHWSGITAPDTLSGPGRLALRLLGPSLGRADVVVVESSRLARAVARYRTAPIATVPCIVPPAVPARTPDDEQIHLVGVGGLIARKGPILAVQTLAEIRARGRGAQLVWVGDGPERAAVSAEAARLGVTTHVRLVGLQPEAGVSAALDAAHLLLLPTLGENFCVVAAESLTHGRPIVSGANTGAVDYADSAVSRFVEERTPQAFAAAVLSLWDATRSLSAEEVAATVAGRFDPATVRAQLENVYLSAGVR